ncbi:MAG: hypothetical protein SNJ77_01570 [Cytophagales bacterium]
MKKKVKPSTDELLQELLRVLAPKEYLEFFEFEGVNNKIDSWEV